MAQSSGSCMSSPSGHSYYKFCCRSPALHVITSHSEAPSLSGDTYISGTEEESDFFSGVRLPSFKSDKYSPNRIQMMKSKHMTYPRNIRERPFKNYCHGDDYLPTNFQNVSVCNGDINGCLPDCPVHSKICNKPVDINKLEESYWAQWKPGKCDSKMTICKPNEKIKSVGGCKVQTTGYATGNLGNINLSNYVQCKTCHKFIEKDRVQPDCIRCLHRNLDIIESDSSELELRTNRTIQEDDENESVDEVANGVITDYAMTPEYMSELTENENSRESVSHRKLHRLGARPSHRVCRTSSRQNEQVVCIAKCSKCRSSETAASSIGSKRYESKCNSLNNIPANRCVSKQDYCPYQKVSKTMSCVKRSDVQMYPSGRCAEYQNVSNENVDKDIVYPTKDKDIDVIKSAQQIISKSSKFGMPTPKSDDCVTTDGSPEAQSKNSRTSSHNSIGRAPSGSDLQKTCSSCCHCHASFVYYCPEVAYCERAKCCNFESRTAFFTAAPDNTGRSGASLINELPEKEVNLEEKRLPTPRSSPEPEKEAVEPRPVRESEAPQRRPRIFRPSSAKEEARPLAVKEPEAPQQRRKIFRPGSAKEAAPPLSVRETEAPKQQLGTLRPSSAKEAAGPQPVREPEAVPQQRMRIFRPRSGKEAAETLPVRESEAPQQRLRRIFHPESIQSEARTSESVDTTDTRPSLKLSNQAKLGTSKRIFIRPHSYPLRTGRTAARGNTRNTSRGRRR